MLNVSDERIESGREFQTVGAAPQWHGKSGEPKIRLLRGTYERFEEEDDLLTVDL